MALGKDLRLPGLAPPGQAPIDLESVLATVFNNEPVDEALFLDTSLLDTTGCSTLGRYALNSDPGREVADWTDLYSEDREVLMKSLPIYIRDKVQHPETVSTLLPHIITSQIILDEPVIDENELVDIFMERARDSFSAMESMFVLGGLFDKAKLADILNKLQMQGTVSPGIAKAVIKAAKSSSNPPMAPVTPGMDQETEANRHFQNVVQRAKESDEVQAYQVDMYAPKIFFKKEADGQLAMVRRLDVGSFAAWLRAYEAVEVWAELGFKHIPVEPILRFKLDQKAGEVDVRTVLLDSQDYDKAKKAIASQHIVTFNTQRQKINNGLDRIGVRHGHLHSGNIQVVSAEAGPRLYVIDFDRAELRASRS